MGRGDEGREGEAKEVRVVVAAVWVMVLLVVCLVKVA